MLRASTICAIALVAFPVVASADAKTISAAQSAVRKVIRERVGSTQRVSFTDTQESTVSNSESVVSGTGLYSQQSSWQGNKGFEYSVRVDRQSRRTRDLQLTLDTGENLGSRGEWIGTDSDDPFVTVTRPTWYERFQSNSVPFQGESKGDVLITVFDPEGDKVAEKQVRPSNGRFQTNIQVPKGLFRAVIQPVLSMEWDEVRFSVQSDSSDWGIQGKRPQAGSESLLTVDQPKDNASYRNGRVEFSGSSKEKVVKIEVTNSRNEQVMKDTLQVRNGRWSTSANLRDGSYSVIIQTANGKDKDARSFRVSDDNDSNVGDENILSLSSPSEGARTGTRVTVAGKCAESAVTIMVYDAKNKVKVNQKVNVRNGSFSLPMTLAAGAHRVVVESQSGRDSDANKFTVDPRLGNGNQGTESLLTVDQPANGAQFRQGRVEFSGSSKENSVKIEVFNSRKDRVMSDTLTVRDGRWSDTANLADGSYTLLIQTASGRDKDTRTFRVSGGTKLPNEGTESILTVSSPSDGSRVGTRVTVSGSCTEGAVRIMVYDSKNKEVVNERVNVRNGSWSLPMTLNAGSHRLVVESQSGRDSDALRFTVGR